MLFTHLGLVRPLSPVSICFIKHERVRAIWPGAPTCRLLCCCIILPATPSPFLSSALTHIFTHCSARCKQNPLVVFPDGGRLRRCGYRVWAPQVSGCGRANCLSALPKGQSGGAVGSATLALCGLRLISEMLFFSCSVPAPFQHLGWLYRSHHSI